MHGPSYIIEIEEYKTTPEMRTPPLIRTLKTVPRVEGFYIIIIKLVVYGIFVFKIMLFYLSPLTVAYTYYY